MEFTMVRGSLKSQKTPTTQRAALVRGARSVKRVESSYVTPMAWRYGRQGYAQSLVGQLLSLRHFAALGDPLLELVADGTPSGWRLRQVLSHCAGEALANWDKRPGRTQLERQALVERALGEFGESTLTLGGAL